MNIRKEEAFVFLAIILISVLINLFILGNTYGEEHSGTVMSDETWYAADNPHIVTGDVTVRGSYYNNYTATLTIEPGCIIKFNPATSLFIGVGEYAYGILNAQGTSDSPIIFTSNASSPAVGDWKGIYFKSISGNTIMDYCEVEYGDNNIYCDQSSPVIKNSTIQNSNNGIYVSPWSSPLINYCTIKDNNNGIYNYGEPTITNCNITKNNQYGIYSSSVNKVTTFFYAVRRLP